MKKNRKGFTLVELLVVISIIALLLSILMPALAKTREQARCLVCKTNLRSYGLAGAMYLQAYRDTFPHPLTCLYSRSTISASHPGYCRWHDASVKPDGPFWPYLAAKKTHCCPTFAGISKSSGSKHANHLASIPIVPTFTYTMNGYLSKGDDQENLETKNNTAKLTRQMPRYTDILHPSTMLFITEENIRPIHTNFGDPIRLAQCALNDMYFFPTKYGNDDSIATFHKTSDSRYFKGVSNVLFVDGHVEEKKAYTQDDLMRHYSDKSYFISTQTRQKGQE